MAQNRSDRGSFITVWPRIVQKIDGFCVTTDDDKSLCALDAPLLACAHRSPIVTISLLGKNSIAGLREQDVAKRLAYKYDSLKSRTTWMDHNSMKGSKKASTNREEGLRASAFDRYCLMVTLASLAMKAAKSASWTSLCSVLS